MRKTIGEVCCTGFAMRGCGAAAAAVVLTLAACGGGGSTGTTSEPGSSTTSTAGSGTTGTGASAPSSASDSAVAAKVPTITNTIGSGVFMRWVEGTINPTVVVGTAGNQTINASTLPNDGPVWTGSNFILHGQYMPYAAPNAPNWNVLQNTMPYLTSDDGTNWNSRYTTIPNPLGAGNYMQVQHVASDGNGTIAAYGIDVSESSPVTGSGELFVAFADVATMTWRVSMLGVQSSLSSPTDGGVSYAYGRWYVSYPAASNNAIASTYIESSDGVTWQPSGAASVRFLTNFKGDSLYRSERATSTDLITWAPYAPAADPSYTYSTPNTNSSISNSKAIVFTPVGKTLGAGATPVRGNTLVSLDGKTWLEGVINGSATAAFTCADRLFMPQYGQYGTALAFLSDDGLNWTQTTLPALNQSDYYMTGGCYAALGRAFLITGGISGNRVFYSG